MQGSGAVKRQHSKKVNYPKKQGFFNLIISVGEGKKNSICILVRWNGLNILGCWVTPKTIHQGMVCEPYKISKVQRIEGIVNRHSEVRKENTIAYLLYIYYKKNVALENQNILMHALN